MYLDDQFKQLEKLPRPNLTSEPLQAAYKAFVQAFLAVEEAETKLQQTHYPPPNLKHFASFDAHTLERDEAIEALESWRRQEPQRRTKALTELFQAKKELARVRTKFTSLKSPKPDHWKWFVTAITHAQDQFAVLAGPFNSPEEAADAQDSTETFFRNTNHPEAAFASYGVSCADPNRLLVKPQNTLPKYRGQ